MTFLYPIFILVPIIVQVTAEVASVLKEAHVEFAAYEGVLDEVRSLAHQKKIFWADPAKVCARHSC